MKIKLSHPLFECGTAEVSFDCFCEAVLVDFSWHITVLVGKHDEDYSRSPLLKTPSQEVFKIEQNSGQKRELINH